MNVDILRGWLNDPNWPQFGPGIHPDPLDPGRMAARAAVQQAIDVLTEPEGLDVETLARAIWRWYHEAEEGLYEDASDAQRVSVRDFALGIAAEYARLRSRS